MDCYLSFPTILHSLPQQYKNPIANKKIVSLLYPFTMSFFLFLFLFLLDF